MFQQQQQFWAHFLFLTFFDNIIFEITLLLKWCPIFDSSPLHQFSKFRNFLLICWFLGKNISNFVSPAWKLDNPYYHTWQIKWLRFLFQQQQQFWRPCQWSVTTESLTALHLLSKEFCLQVGLRQAWKYSYQEEKIRLWSLF